MTPWSSLPTKGKTFILLVALVAIPLFLNALRNVFIQYTINHQISVPTIALAAILLITVPLFVSLPGVRSSVTTGDALIISICMLDNTSTAMVANVLYVTYVTLMLRRKHNTPAHRLLFNIAMAAINVSLYGSVYHLLNPTSSHALKDILIPTFGLALTFYCSNSVFLATAISLTTEVKFLDVFKNFLPLALEFLVSACAGAFIQLFQLADKYAPVIAAPFVAAVYGLMTVNRAKALDAERHLKEQEQLYLRTVESLALAVDAKDQITHGHIRRVRAYAMALAKYCGITDANELMAIETGSLLHDIGKLAVEDYILNKPGPLSELEYERMKVHVAAGDEILRQIQFPFPVADFVRFHHERWDGRGYPNGLRDEEIPLGARILAVADAFDAMRSSRPYKLSLGIQEVIERLRTEAGTMYDPKLVNLFIEHLDELELAATQASANIAEQSLKKYFTKIEFQEASRQPHILTSKVVQGSANELIQLSEFCSGHGRYLEVPEICRIISSRIERLVPYSTCAFFIDTGQHSLKPAFIAGGLPEILAQVTIELGKGISGWVAAYRQPLISAKPALEFQGCQGNFSKLTGALVVPLVAGDRCFGTISLYSDGSEIYNKSQQELLQTVACIVAPVLGESRDRKKCDTVTDAVDSITGTHSSAYLSVVGPGLIAAAEQNKAPLSLLNLEVNNLRQIERVYGPASAESILTKVAETFRIDLRETDVLVRFGTQGFVAMLPGVRQDQAARWAQRLQQRTRSITIGAGPGQGTFASCMVAVAAFPQDGSDIYGLIASAQQSLATQSKPRVASSEEAPSSVIGFPPRA